RVHNKFKALAKARRFIDQYSTIDCDDDPTWKRDASEFRLGCERGDENRDDHRLASCRGCLDPVRYTAGFQPFKRITLPSVGLPADELVKHRQKQVSVRPLH